MTAPLKPESLIIFRESVFDNDIFMTIAKIALALDLFLSLPQIMPHIDAHFL